MGDLVSASTALGLHRDVENSGPVSIVSELRKRVFAIVFNVDKGSSLLTGRPPALSFRYCRFKLPLDVSDEVLVEGGDALRKAIENVDENGWNKEGKLYPNTTTRAHSKLAIVLNEILELSLGELDENPNEQIKFVLSSHLGISSLTDPGILWISWNAHITRCPALCFGITSSSRLLEFQILIYSDDLLSVSRCWSSDYCSSG